MIFLDGEVTKTEWDAIQKVSSFRFMEGNADGSFHPRATVTMAELLKTICTVSCGGKIPQIPKDTSVPEIKNSYSGHWAQQYAIYSMIFLDFDENFLGEDPESKASVKFAADAFSNLFDNFRCNCIFNLTQNPELTSLKEENAVLTRGVLALAVNEFINIIGSQVTTSNWSEITNKNSGDTSLLFLSYADSSYMAIKDIIKSNSLYNRLPCVRLLFKINQVRNECLQSVQCTAEEIGKLFHYTTISAVEKLTQPFSKFRLSNSVFLNDPSESRTFTDFILNHLVVRHKEFYEYCKKPRETLQTSRAYIGSFIPSKDSLPMWYQYADQCRGCAIGIEADETSPSFYKVKYKISKSDHIYKNLMSLVDDAKKTELNSGEKKLIYGYLKDIIDELSFIYKDPNYKHEQEVRIIQLCHPQHMKCEDSPRRKEVFPRPFCEVSLKIKSIVFGPRAENVHAHALGLAVRNHNIEVSQNNIPIR